MLTKAGQELSNKGSPNLPGVVSRIKVFFVIVEKVSPKSKTVFHFESLCCHMDMSMFL